MVRNLMYLHPYRDANGACRLHFLPKEAFLTECRLIIKIYISRPLLNNMNKITSSILILIEHTTI